MSPEDQASQLARWLAERPGVEPPEGIDPEVIEAVYALRPDLAPAPRVTVDDILAGVTSGPFAGEAAPAAPPEAAPVPGVDAEIVSFSAAAARRKRRLWSGAGVFAAAAMALFVVTTGDMNAPGPGSSAEQRAERALRDAPVAQAPEAEPSGDAALEASGFAPPAEEAPAPARPSPKKASSTSGPAPAATSGSTAAGGALSSSRYDQLKVGGEVGAEDASVADAFGDEVWTEEQAEKASAQPSPLEPVDAPAQAPVAETSVSKDYWGGADERAQQRAYDLDDLDEVESADRQDLADVQTASGRASSTRREREGLLGRRGTSNMATSEAPAAAEADYAYAYDAEEEEIAEEEPLPTDLAGLRALAWPGDYGDRWWEGSSAAPRMSPALSAASAAAASGDNAAAAQACAALINDPSAPVGQDMAWRAANYAWQAGDAAAASRYITQGKSRSSANTAFLARLYAMEGQLLEAGGDPEAARQAYRTAAVLNQAR